MFNLGPLELMAIFVVALLVFGPDKLPEIGRQVGRAIREFRRFQSSFQTDLRDTFDSHLAGPIVPGPAPVTAQVPEPSGESPPPAGPEADGEAEPAPEARPSEGTPPDAASR
jgi:sec-independent protein translocase protein TatA